MARRWYMVCEPLPFDIYERMYGSRNCLFVASRNQKRAKVSFVKAARRRGWNIYEHSDNPFVGLEVERVPVRRQKDGD